MIKYLRLIIPVILLAGVLVFLVISNAKPADCTKIYSNDKTVTINSQKIQAEVSDSNQERQQGLSGRDCIGDKQGMLFVFEKPGNYSFWMKDMKFAIDIIWINQDKKIVGIEKKVEPSTYPDGFVNKDRQALYVLEVKSGKVDELGAGLDTPVNF